MKVQGRSAAAAVLLVSLALLLHPLPGCMAQDSSSNKLPLLTREENEALLVIAQVSAQWPMFVYE